MRAAYRWMAIGLAGVGLIVGCKNPQLSGGILHFDQMRYERARETLLEAVQQEPANPEAHFMLGKAYAELDSTMLARRSLDRAFELAGERHPTKEDVANALEHYWSVKHNEGLSAAKAAQEDEAAARVAEEKKLAEQKEASSRQNFILALNSFRKARVYDPTKEETPRNMGAVYFKLGDVDSGLVALRESQQLAPVGDERAASLLFDQYRFLGDNAAGKRNAEGYPEPKSLRDAIRFYSEAESLRANEPDLLFSIGVVYYQLAEADSAERTTNLDRAATYFERTLKISPEDQEALYNAASLNLELKGCTEGLEQAERLLDLDPKQGRYHDLVGRLRDCLGQKQERIAGLVFARALRSGEVLDLSRFKEYLDRQGAQSDLLRKYREEGVPEEVRTFTDATGAEYSTWFYWSRGKALAFVNGEKKYEQQFKPQRTDE